MIAAAATDEAGAGFPSFAALRAANADLLRAQRAQGGSEMLISAAREFIVRGQRAGALIDSEDERLAAQSLLDYWSSLLGRAGEDAPDATLQDFDPSLAPELDEELCPYRGLDAFEETHHNQFFGRGRLVDECLHILEEQALLVVIGPSGGGKSSLVLGGVMPRMHGGALPGSQELTYLSPFTPGTDPLLALVTSVLGRRPSPDQAREYVGRLLADPRAVISVMEEAGIGSAVLVIDQFEEVFTLCGNPAVRQAFVDSVLHLADHAPHDGARQRVILTMRTDFESYVVRLPDLQARFEQARIEVPALSGPELREAIEKPAQLVGLKFEEGIVDDLVKSLVGEPAALPLLQFCLLRLWNLRQRNRITWEAYHSLGDAPHALANCADQFYESLIPEDQLCARRILLRLVRPTEGKETMRNRVRRPALYLAGEARDRVDRVLDKLVLERLVRLTKGDTAADDQLEVAHEALVRNWPKLEEWLDEDRVTMRRRLRMTAAAEHWQSSGRDPDALWRGGLLDEALRYDDLNEVEAAFVQASREAGLAAERAEQAARQRDLAQANALAEAEWGRAEAEAERANAERQRAVDQATTLRRLRGVVVVAMLDALIPALLGWAFLLMANALPQSNSAKTGFFGLGGLAFLYLIPLTLVFAVAFGWAVAGQGSARASRPTSRTPSTAEQRRRRRGLAWIAFIGTVTLGGYLVYWTFATTREVATARGQRSVNPVWHFLSLVLLLPLVFGLYGYFVLSEHIADIRSFAHSNGVHTRLHARRWTLALIASDLACVIALVSIGLEYGATASVWGEPFITTLLLATAVSIVVRVALIWWAQRALNAAWALAPASVSEDQVAPESAALRLINRARWGAMLRLRVAGRIQELAGAHVDSRALLAAAQQDLAVERERDLSDLRQEAAAASAAGQWADAIALYETIQRETPGDADASAQLSRARQAFAASSPPPAWRQKTVWAWVGGGAVLLALFVAIPAVVVPALKPPPPPPQNPSVAAVATPVAMLPGAGVPRIGPVGVGATNALAVDTFGNLFVADAVFNRVFEVETVEGYETRVWGGTETRGSAAGQFDRPVGIGLDGQGNIYVADAGNKRIQKLSPDGVFVAQWGAGAQDVKPNDLSVDTQGNVYVAGDDDRVYKFASDGTPLGQWGGSGSEPGQMRNPEGVHAGQDGAIYVSDTNNDRIEKFSPEGRFLAAYGSSGSGPGQLSHPTAAVVDRQGNLFVADGGNHRIQKLAPDGRYLATYGDDGMGGSWLHGTLVTLAIDHLNVLYVGDSEAHQVLYFAVGPFEYSGTDLRDHKVQLTVDSPAVGQHIAQRLQLGVGPDARIPDLSLFGLSTNTPSAVGIELAPTGITFDFSQAGSGTFRGGSFNGYIFYTSNDTPPIADVSIDPSTTLGIDAARIFWNRREIRVNVQGLNHDSTTVARLNLKF